mgnify:CR=1 FL=1
MGEEFLLVQKWAPNSLKTFRHNILLNITISTYSFTSRLTINSNTKINKTIITYIL